MVVPRVCSSAHRCRRLPPPYVRDPRCASPVTCGACYAHRPAQAWSGRMQDIERWPGDARGRRRATAWRDLVFTVATAPGASVAPQTRASLERISKSLAGAGADNARLLSQPSIPPMSRTRRRWTRNGASASAGRSTGARWSARRLGPTGPQPAVAPRPNARPEAPNHPPQRLPTPVREETSTLSALVHHHTDQAKAINRPRYRGKSGETACRRPRPGQPRQG